jgi:hypothetical protein
MYVRDLEGGDYVLVSCTNPTKKKKCGKTDVMKMTDPFHFILHSTFF